MIIDRGPNVVLRATLLAVAGWVATGLVGCGTSGAPARADRTADIAQLTRQSDAWDKAIVRKDSTAIVANMSDDFRQIDGRGNVESRASFVEGLLTPKLTIDPYTVEDFDVRLYGDVALLCGRTRMSGSYDGERFTSHYRYIDIYARTQGVWKIVSVQISPIPT